MHKNRGSENSIDTLLSVEKCCVAFECVLSRNVVLNIPVYALISIGSSFHPHFVLVQSLAVVLLLALYFQSVYRLSSVNFSDTFKSKSWFYFDLKSYIWLWFDLILKIIIFSIILIFKSIFSKSNHMPKIVNICFNIFNCKNY